MSNYDDDHIYSELFVSGIVFINMSFIFTHILQWCQTYWVLYECTNEEMSNMKPILENKNNI